MALILRKFLLLALAALYLLTTQGCRSRADDDFTPYVVRIYLEESARMPPSHVVDMVLPISRSHIVTQSKPVFAEWDIAGAGMFETDFGPAILLLFTNAAATEVYRTTVQNMDRRLVMTVNGFPIAARRIERPVQDGRLFFFPEIEESEVTELTAGIQKTSNKIHEAHQKQKRW